MIFTLNCHAILNPEWKMNENGWGRSIVRYKYIKTTIKKGDTGIVILSNAGGYHEKNQELSEEAFKEAEKQGIIKILLITNNAVNTTSGHGTMPRNKVIVFEQCV